jgi:hypothetical protein
MLCLTIRLHGNTVPAPSIEIEMFTLTAKSASRPAFIRSWVATRLSNTATAVVGVSRPAIPALKSGSVLRFQ